MRQALILIALLLLAAAAAVLLGPGKRTLQSGPGMAGAALRSDEPRQTAVSAREAARQQQVDTALLKQAGQQALESGDSHKAIQVWQSEAEQAPGADVYGRLAQAHLALDDYPGAIADLQAQAVYDPENAGLNYQIGLLTATQDPEAALAYLQRAAELDVTRAVSSQTLRQAILAARPEDDRVYSLMGAGRGLASLGEWRYATEAFRQATLARPDYAEAWAYLGEGLQHLSGEPSSLGPETPVPSVGLSELQKAFSLDSKSVAANLFLALFWQRQGNYPQALEVLRRAIPLVGDSPVLQAELGNTLALQGDLEAALQAYQQAIELAPQDSETYNLLTGFTLKYEYLVSEIGLPAARRAVVLAPRDLASLDWMAQVLIYLNDLTSAERFLQRALELDPGFTPSLLHLGIVHLFRNEGGKAIEYFNEVTKLAPDSPQAEQARRLIENNFP